MSIGRSALFLLLATAPAVRAAQMPSSATVIDDESAEAASRAANQRRLAALSKIGPAQAETAALALAPKGWIGETELAEDKTLVVYNVTVVTRARQIRKVRVDAATGHILGVELVKLEGEDDPRFKKWGIPPQDEDSRHENDD